MRVLVRRDWRGGTGTTRQSQRHPEPAEIRPAVAQNRPPDIVASLKMMHRITLRDAPCRQTILTHHMGQKSGPLVLTFRCIGRAARQRDEIKRNQLVGLAADGPAFAAHSLTVEFCCRIVSRRHMQPLLVRI